MTSTFTKTQVAQHNTKADGWFIVNNGVYNISKFYDDHPGGRDILLMHIGTDATEAFEGNNHSRGAYRKLEDLKIGTLVENERRKFITYADVAAKKDKTGAWFVVNNKVYDITPFLDNHPGGRDILLYNAGQDASAAFINHGHSDAAFKMIEKFVIGDIDPSERKPIIPRKAPAAAAAAEASATVKTVRHQGDESLMGRIQAQLKLLIFLGIFIMAGYLLLG